MKKESKKLKIAFDIDGVISDFVATFIPLVKERYSIDLAVSDIYVHDLFLVLGITEQEVKELVLETLNRPINPISGAVETLQRIYKNHEVIIITARPPGTETITKEWLEINNIPYHSLIWLNEGNKHTHNQKFDIIIDDHLREVLRFHNKADRLVIFDHPWNQTKNVRDLVTRVFTWNDIEALVSSLSK